MNHFAHTDFYVSIMPPYLPWHLALVYVSGACGVALGIALLGSLGTAVYRGQVDTDGPSIRVFIGLVRTP